MMKKKIVMLGSFAVGKTSLVQRFVNSIFSEKYQTTIGVKIDQKTVVVDGTEVNLLLWDIHGEDDYQKVKPIYIMGSSGCFIVIDGTRLATLTIGNELIEVAKKTAPNSVIVVLINKSDLKNDWDITESDIDDLKNKGYEVIETSAKTSEAVELAFNRISQLMLKE
jgi:small GTP-binding protein